MTAITFLQGADQGGVPIWLLLKHWVVQMAWEKVVIIAGKQMKLRKLDCHLDRQSSHFLQTIGHETNTKYETKSPKAFSEEQ